MFAQKTADTLGDVASVELLLELSLRDLVYGNLLDSLPHSRAGVCSSGSGQTNLLRI